MKLLLDENTPEQLLHALRQVLSASHVIDHVVDIQWSGKKDKDLIPDARTRGYDVLVTKDSNQLADPEECDALKRAGIHHVRFGQGMGLDGLARAMGALIAAMPGVVRELASVNGQRLVKVKGIGGSTRRHECVDPRKHPPAYWR